MAEPMMQSLGFVAADKMPEKPKGTIKFPGELGKLLGTQQRFRGQIILEGEYHSGKSELQKQIADVAIDAGMRVALVDWEQGGLVSKDTNDSIARNLKPQNRSKLFVSGDVPMTVDGLRQIANSFDMILVDSGTKVKKPDNAWLDDLRVDFPNTIWVINMQRNSDGKTRGGSSAGYNAPVIIYTYRPDKSDFRKNYALIEKNRGNPETMQMKYNIYTRKISPRHEQE